jgi:hypothetical protein
MERKKCEYCGSVFLTKLSRQKYCSKECAGYASYHRKTRDTICWDCKKSTGGEDCPWANEFKPVEGWDATPTTIKMIGKSKRNKGKIEPSFKVNSCPLFKKG